MERGELHNQSEEHPRPLQAERGLLHAHRSLVQEVLCHIQTHQSSLKIFLWTNILGQCDPLCHALEWSHESSLHQPAWLARSHQEQLQIHHLEGYLQPLDHDVLSSDCIARVGTPNHELFQKLCVFLLASPSLSHQVLILRQHRETVLNKKHKTWKGMDQNSKILKYF